MRFRYFSAVMILIVILCVCTLSACKKETATASDYKLYTYDSENNKFTEVGCRLHFNEEKTDFVLNYAETIQLFGEVKAAPSGYILHIDEEVYKQATQSLALLTEDQLETQSEAVQEIWDASLSTDEQVFFFGDYVFSSLSIDLIRRVEDGSKKSYTSIEGYYESANNTENIFLFKDGYVYANVQDKDGKATFKDDQPVMRETPSASYMLNQGFAIMTRIDKDGGVVLNTKGAPDRVVYLLASITYPQDIAEFIYTDDDYSETTKVLAEQLAGKTVGLMTKSFYSSKDLSELDFN